MTEFTTAATDAKGDDVEARLARLEARTRPVTEADVDAISEEYEGDPLGELAHGQWHPSSPVEVAFALSLLAAEVNLTSLGVPAPVMSGRDLEALIAAPAAPVKATAVDPVVAALRPKWLPILEAFRSAEDTIAGIDRSWQQAIQEMDNVSFDASGREEDALCAELRERCGYHEVAEIGDRIVEIITRSLGGVTQVDVRNPAR
ncbi:MAG: hypothetical protein ACYCXY_10585 [Acidimicrobiales bacterium]